MTAIFSVMHHPNAKKCRPSHRAGSPDLGGTASCSLVQTHGGLVQPRAMPRGATATGGDGHGGEAKGELKRANEGAHNDGLPKAGSAHVSPIGPTSTSLRLSQRTSTNVWSYLGFAVPWQREPVGWARCPPSMNRNLPRSVRAGKPEQLVSGEPPAVHAPAASGAVPGHRLGLAPAEAAEAGTRPGPPGTPQDPSTLTDTKHSPRCGWRTSPAGCTMVSV